MKLLSILTLLCLFSINAYAEKCEGINACADLYSKLTDKKLSIDPVITDEVTLAVPDVDLTKENANVEFEKFLNKNGGMTILDNTVVTKRVGEFLTAPVHVVSDNNIPMMLNKDGLVTFVYHTKGSTKRLADKTRSMLSKKKLAVKTFAKTIEFPKNKIMVVCDTYEKADKIVRLMIKLDK